MRYHRTNTGFQGSGIKMLHQEYGSETAKSSIEDPLIVTCSGVAKKF